MKILIVGCGKVGTTLAEQLSTEDHEVTIIDTNSLRVSITVDKLDVLGIVGNGASIPVLMKAGADEADLIIAVTETDELNLLSCLIGKRLGAINTIARVRNPEYADSISLIKDDLGLSMSINPEYACAAEMARVLKFPSMIKVDTFARGRAELLQFAVREGSPLIGIKLSDMSSIADNILVCAVERKESVFIPSGDFVIEKGDRLSIVGEPENETQFFSRIGMFSNRIRSIMIVGGGRIAYYLAKMILPAKVSVKIIENNPARSKLLSDLLPDVEVIQGDGSDQQLLLDEGVQDVDAFASLTGIDEENIMLSLYVGVISKAKLITKITRNPFINVISTLDLGSVFYPRLLAAENILRYVRALQNSYGSSVETLYKIINDKAEALEFYVNEECDIKNIPFSQLKTKPNLLIGSINRDGKIIIPSGNDVLMPGDTVVVITTHKGLGKLEDIVE